jgi:hypothetical protein
MPLLASFGPNLQPRQLTDMRQGVGSQQFPGDTLHRRLVIWFRGPEMRNHHTPDLPLVDGAKQFHLNLPPGRHGAKGSW